MNIFLGNLPRDLTEDDLREAFGAYGKVNTVSVIKDKYTGQPRGFGFVEMQNKNEGQAAIAGVNGKMIKGKSLNVNEARPKTEGARGGATAGGGGPRRGGGGGGGKRPY